MTLRTSYIVGLIACTAVGLTSVQIIESAHAETLKITGPNGEVKQQAKRQYGPTTSRDTFWSIAQKVRPSDKVSVYQVMAALFDANPHAFSGNNYNTLERGMILLVPSVDVIAAIPNDVAKRRAEQDDRRASRQTQPRPVINNKPIQSPIVETPKKPTVTKPLQIVQQTPAVEVQTKAITEANAVVVNDLNSTLDKANAKTLMLTDELARAQDELMVSNNDNQVLKNKIEQMSLNISSLEEDLQLLREKYDALNIENQKLVEQIENAEPVIEKPTDFWRSLMDNTILLILAASIPLLIIFGLIFWLLSRRNKKNQQSEIKTATQSEQESSAAINNDDTDDSDDIVVHLDSNDEESIDDLLDLDSVDLQPEIQMDGDAEMDMASDMFVSETEIEDEEGTSLDDLWAEAMEEQDTDLEPLEDDDDLDSLLAGLDDKPASTLNSAAPEDDLDSLLAGLDEDTGKDDIDDLDASAENDIDSLLAEFDMPAESNDVDVEDAVKPAETSADDDIDSLLAEFDMPAESNDVDVEDAVKPAETSTDDDIDSLLAEFDMPAESDDVAAEEPVKSAETSAEDDIDALLAEFDMPAESNDVAVEDAVKPVETSADDDIDSLLAEFDMPAESDDVDVEDAVKPVETSADDDIDSSLAEFDMPIESDDVDVEEPVKSVETSADDKDIDELVESNDVVAVDDITLADDIKSVEDFIPVDDSTSIGEMTSTDDLNAEDDIDSLLSASDLEQSDVAAPIASDDDIDEPLAGLSATKNESEDDSQADYVEEAETPSLTSDSVNNDDDIAALIAAELQDDINEDNQDIDEPSDDDIDALLSSLNEPVIESVFDEKSDELSTGEQASSDSDDLAAQIAAELSDDEDVVDSLDSNETSDDDIDALLASLNEPVIESDADLEEKAAVQAQIAAELDDDTSSEESTSDDESLDDDINTLLASFKDDIKDDAPLIGETENIDSDGTQIDGTQSDNESIDDNALFDEFDEYLNDIDLTNTDDVADIETTPFIEPETDADKAADSDDEDNSWLDAELEAALASTSNNDAESDQETTAIPTPVAMPTSETDADDGLDALLAQMDDDDKTSSTAQNNANKDSGFFNDLKSSKPKPELLDWESDLLKAAESAADEREVDEADVSDDDLLAAFSQSLKDDDNDDDFTSEDEYILSDDNLTVDEALAALDQKERSQSTEYKASDDDLMRFERENGYIDIDKLLNDADEDDDKTDQYKDVNVDMGSVNSLIGNPNMIDVDDEENSVNAKLDLARAYIEIEDQDSARALLKEVQMDGNERQQLEAKNLLKSVN
ncbi:FimV/HubP family polar landmark protein [Shewanella frigidimarina]|uniref:FimV/HubP family polar landmark protein n=1 Tax=Shewanella frigidimarina TaxID=56812 RepID=UPI003D78E39B